MKFAEYINKQSKITILVVGFSFILFWGVFDYLTGPQIAFSIFYLFPISFVAWFAGKRSGVVISIAGAIVWFYADLLSGAVYSHPAIFYWNTIVRLGFFLIVTEILTRYKKSKEGEKELNQFIIHDLRSPLGNVISGLQNLEEIAIAEADPVKKDLIQLCLVSCDKIMLLINSLLDLNRFESKNMNLNLGRYNVKELVEASVNQVKLWANTNFINMKSEIEAGCENVFTDFELTMRIIVNLLSNSIKNSKPGSTITVHVKPLGTKLLSFNIIDQGKGISKEWENKVFEKYSQVQASKVGELASGSGIGLTFCRIAVELLGGHIWLKSIVDQGTTVTFSLPLDGKV
jgi:signal transduction histidine kinase